MSLDGAKLRYVDESGLPVVVAAKGRTFQVGSYLSCDLVLDGPQVEELLCEIKCDAFGRVTINNKSIKELVHLNDKVLHGKRPLLHGGRITILNQVYTWEFPKISETEDVPRTPERLSPVEQASNSCPSLKLQSHRPQIDKRLTVHNFRYCINSDDEGNTSIESRDESDAHVEADESQRCKTPPNADDEPAAEAGQTPKVDLLDATQNKENTATPPASHKKLLKLCALSDVVITSFSPRETGVKTEKSFTCVRKPNVTTISTPKSVYSTPKSVLSELNEDSCSRDLLDFSTPSTSKKTRRKTSMYLIDLTTPQKLRPTLKHTPIIVSDSADESSGASPLVIDITQADTPPSPAPAPSHKVAKTPKRLAAAATPKRTPQSLMKRALLTSTKKQIAANRAEPTTPVAAPKRPSLLQARRQCLTTPTRLPFHSLKRTAAQRAADQEKAKTPRTSPRKGPSLFFASPRENKLSQMRQSLAGARRSPNVEMSNKLVSKARRSLSNSPRDGSPKLESPRIGSPRHGSPKPASSIAPLTPQTSGSALKELNISKSKCSTPEKLDDSGDDLSRTFTIKDDHDESGGEPSRAGSTVETAVATEEPPVDAVDEIPIIEDSICEEIHVDLPEKIVEGAVLIDDSICEELPTDPKANAEASQKDQLESLKTIEEDKTSIVKASTVEKPAMEVEKEAPALRTPLPRRSSRRLSADQRTLATTPRRSTRRASVEVNSDQNVIGQRTRRASCSAADTQALATPTRKRRLTEEMGTPTRQSKRLLNTPKRTNLVDESVGDMGVIVEEAAPADEKEKAAAEDEDYGTELATDEPDNVDYHGLRDMLKTPKSCSTPLYKGLRELMQTPKMPASPILGNIEELLERSDSVSDTPRRSRQRAPAGEPEGRNLDRILKTPSAKNIMVPNEPASAMLHSRKDYTSDSVLISCNLSVGRHTLPLDNIFHDVPSTSAVHADDSEFEINVTSVSTATDADPLAASKRNESVSSEDLMNLSAATTYRKTATTSTTYKAAIRADLNLSTLTEEGGASRDTSPSVNDISGIQLLDQTSDSMFCDPLVVSVSGVESGDVTVEETKAQTVRPPSEPIPSDDRSDTDSIVGLSEPLVFSDDEETIAEKDIPHKKVEESAVTSPNKHAATDPTNTNGKDIPISVEGSIEAVDSLVDEISLIEVQDITTESSINATKGNTMPNDSSMIIELDSSEDTKAPQAKETDVSSVVEATITESETYPLDSTIEYSAIELNVSSPVANKEITAAKPGILVSEVEASSFKELPEESAAEKSEVEVESAPKELPEESITEKGTERKPVEERSPIKEAPESAVRDIDEEEKDSCEEYPAPKEKEDTPSVENSLDIIQQMPEAKETPTDVSLVKEGSEVEDILGLSAVVNAVQDTIDFEDPQTLSHETATSTDEPEHKELEASSAPKPAGEQRSEASPATESASEPTKEAHSPEVDSNVVDVTQDISRAESPKEAETPPEDGAIQLDAFSILETVDQESTSIIDPPQEADVVPEKSLIEKLPEESLIEEVPEESLIKEVPEESLIEEEPEESLIKDVPEESLIEEEPEESLIKEVPEESLIEKVPEESLIEDVPEESLIEKLPEESLIEEVPQESLIEEVPEESLIKDVPEESLIEEEPEESLIKEVLEESLVEEVQEESLIEEAPEESLVDDLPEESFIEEVPEDSLIEEIQDDSIALETTLDEIRSEDQQTNGPKVEELPSRNQKEDVSPLDVPSDAEANEKPAAGGQDGSTKSAIDTAKETNNLDESTAGDLAEDEVIQLDASNRLEDVSTVEEMPELEGSPAEEPADGKDKEDAIQQDSKPEDTTQNKSPSEGQRSNGQDAETSASEAAEKTSPSDKSVIGKPEEAFLLEESTDMELTKDEFIPEVAKEAEKSPTKEPARENGNDEEVIQLDDSNYFEDVVPTLDGRKSPSDELLKAVDEELAREAETLPSEQTSVQRKSTNDDKVIPGDASSNAETHEGDIDQSLSGHTTEDEITADVSAVDPKATPTATAMELPKESEMKSTSEAKVIPETCTTNEAAASLEDSTSETVSEATPDEHKVEAIISTPERNIQQETETKTGPEAEQRGPSPSVEAPVDAAKELPQSTPGKEEETSEIVLRSTKEPALSDPCSIAEGSVTPPPAVEPVKNPLPEKEEESAQTESSEVPVPSAPTSIVEEGTPSLAVEKALGESKELTQSSAQKETSEIIFESTKEPALNAQSSIAEESNPSPVVEVPGPEKAEESAQIRSEHSRGSVPNAPTSSVQEEPAPLAVQEPLGELSQSSPDKGRVSVEIPSDSTKEPAANAPICIDDESTPLSTEEIQSVSSTSESEEVIDETPTNQSIIGLIAANKPSASTAQSANDEIQIISDDSQSVSSPKEETSSQDDDEDDDEDCDEAMDMLEEQVDPVDLHVNRRETTTKVFPSKVQMDDDVIELSDSNSSHDPQEKVPTETTAPTVEAATEAPEADKPSSSGAPAGVVEPKAMSVKSYTTGSAKEDEVAAASPEDTPREAALELTPAPNETTGASVSETQTFGSALDEEQDIAAESERDRRNTLATEKPLESNSENGNQALEENTLKNVEEEKDAENREKQEPEVAAEEAVKQEARKVTRLARNDGQPPAKEIQPAAKRARKGSSVERTAEASELERPRRRGRKPSAEVQPILEEKDVITNTRRGRKPSKQSSEEAKDNEAQPKTEEILNPITEDNMPSEHVKQMDPPKRNQEESKELLPSTTRRGRGRPPSAEKDQARKAKARELLAAIKVDQTVDSAPKKLPKRVRKTPEVVQEVHMEVMPETSKRNRRAPTAEKEATKDDPHIPKTHEHLAAIKEDPPAGDEPKKTLKRARKSSELVKTEEASQQPAKEGQPDAQADRPKRRGRKPSMDVEVAAPEVPEHPRRRGQKADPTPEKESASMKPVDHHLEEIAEEIEREPEPKKLLLDEEEPKTRRRGRKATAETTDVPMEHVEAASSRRRARKATVEEGTADQVEPKSKRHSGEGLPPETPLPEIQEASTVKTTRRGRKPSVDVDTAEKKQPSRALRKPSTSVDEGTPQAKKTTARRGRKASAQAEGIDAQKNVQDVTTELAATVTATALASAEKPNDGVYPSPSHTEDELTPRRREGRNLPRKNYTEVPDDDKPSSGSRRNRKPVTSGKAAAAKTLEMEVHPTTPTPSQKGPPIEEAVRATPATPEMATVTLPDPTTSQRREGRNLPRKNYTEAPDDDKPTPSRSRRQRNPTVKALELIVDTTPRPATPRRRRGKAGTEEPHEEAPAAKKVAEETEVATVAAVKGRGTRRKAEDEAEADSAAPTKHAARAGNSRKAKVETEPDSEDQPATKKARGGARAKTPAVIISDEEPAEQPVVAVSAKKPADRGRGRAAKAAPIVEPEAMQPVPSAEAAAPSASTARSGRAKKVHFEATLPAADSATSNDEAPKRATRSRRK
ncbi:titin isoform X2 [Drosophila pseudoobscura]|uniref:Titin isoform X2 n=1 Tax=Drosophila pseudoobscura pseudoobscura TaxID=46245 RepID=A0A6I8VNT9_DROPS|nr:titin isoform X2 [Drosophila pseudoobscura]